MKRISKENFHAELNKIKHGLHRYAPQKVILFGSFARGDYHAGSDVDLLVIKESAQPFIERSAEVLRTCQSALAIEALVYTPDEFEQMIQQDNPFILQAIIEGQMIYEQESANRSTLANPGAI